MNKFSFFTYKKPVSLVIVAIIASGLFIFQHMQISLFPEITFPKLKVIADIGEQPVDKMMITVTRPLESAIKQIPDLELIRSTTSRGSCEISAFLKWGADVNINQQMLESRINEIKEDLPQGVRISVEKMNPSILPVMGFALESKTKTPIELNLIATYVVKPFLSQIDGVSSVRIIGGKTKEYQVILNPQKMSSAGVTPDMISNVLSQTNFIDANGMLSDYRRLYLSVTDAGLYSKSDIEQVVIKNDGKRILQLKDLAKVEVQEHKEYTRINANGRQALLVAILKQPGANLINLSEKYHIKEQELRRILPKDVLLTPYYDQADFVHDAIHSVNDSLWIGLILALMVSILFLRSFRACATILITIPVTLLLTILVLFGIGYTLNIMTLGAIAAAIGLIIDDAVVVVEQIHRTKEELPQETAGNLVSQSIHYLLPSMIGSSISTIVIFVPFILMSGVAGAYFTVLTNTMIITLICSFLVTWLGLPVIYLLLSPRTNSPKEKTIEIKPVRSRRWVSFFVRRPWISIGFIGLLIALILLLLPNLKTGFLPEMDEGSIVLDYNSPAGTSLEETDRMLHEIEKIIIAEPEYQSYSRRTGAQMGFYITEPNRGDYLIQLKKVRNRSTEDVISDLRSKIESTQPALRVDFGQVINDMLGDLMESAEPIEIKIFGDDHTILNHLSREAAKRISNVEGIADVFDGITIAGPSIIVKPNSQKLAQFGLTPSGLQSQLQTQMDGSIVGSVLEKEQKTDIRIIFPDSLKSGLNAVRQQNIFLTDGKLKPISELAEVSISEGAEEIHRDNLQTVGIVTARLDNRDLGMVMRDIQKHLKTLYLPPNYHIEYGGSYAHQQKSFSELLLILVLSCLLVFTLILFLFRDFRAASIILLIAALGTSGSILALYLTKTPLNVGSYTGLIMIVGIIGENAIFTFQQFSTRRKSYGIEESLIYAISTRLRPKLMTALGAIIALLPLAIGIGAGAQMHQPLAIAVIGGFLIALPLLLIILPSLLRLVYRDKNHETNPSE